MNRSMVVVRLVCAGVLAVLSGCRLLPADAVLDIEGFVTTESGSTPSDCSLALYTKSGEEIGHQAIATKFAADFVVSPATREYYVEIDCSGYAIYRSGTFVGPNDYSDPPLDLGEVTLRLAGK